MVKTDTVRSTPYLLKFYHSPADLSCFIFITDTKSVWAEVLTSNQFSRRWRHCNPDSPPLFPPDERENSWRTTSLEHLSKVHSLGVISDFTFDIVESNYADIAFELEGDGFKWRWETCFLGHRFSAELISKHLIFPLISVNHLSFSSVDSVSELPDFDLEKAVDKIGRTARRTVDTHIKNALSKPRVATTLRRMTAMFNFVPDLPPVTSVVDSPDLTLKGLDEGVSTEKTPPKAQHVSPPPASLSIASTSRDRDQVKVQPVHPDSATESEAEEEPIHLNKPKESSPFARHGAEVMPTGQVFPKSSSVFSSTPVTKGETSDSDSEPPQPTKQSKKPRIASSSDDDSDSKARVVQKRSGSGAGGIKRGTKQPIKRGGKRF